MRFFVTKELNHEEIRFKPSFAFFPRFVWSSDKDGAREVLIFFEPFVKKYKWNGNHFYWNYCNDFLPEVLE